MPEEVEWSALFTQSPEDGPLGPDAVLMLHLEAELIANDIEVVFDPMRPGEDFHTRGWRAPNKLMVPTRDLSRALEIKDAVLSYDPEESTNALEATEADVEPSDDTPVFASDIRRPREASGPPQGGAPIHPGCLVGLLALLVALGLLTTF